MREIKFMAYHDKWGWAEPADISMMGDGCRYVDYRGENGDTISTYEGSDKEIHVVEYTGLKDSKNVEIYEGDIVRAVNNLYPDGFNSEWANNNVVGYDDGQFVFGEYKYSWGRFTQEESGGQVITKVIGNIYENADLLEES